jgi:DNA helicase-2/ATP-dependent DNA helicase PcrA
MEEDLFPSQMMLESRADLEEERRLFYVAITRAERKLMLSYAETRYRFGRLKGCEPSRFLNEIDEIYIQMKRGMRRHGMDNHSGRGTQAKEAEADYRPTAPTSFVKNLTSRPMRSEVVKPATNYTPSPDFQPSDTSKLKAGMRVEHLKFGYGSVQTVEQTGNDRKAHIVFETVGEKTLLLSFAKLRIVQE